MRRSCGFSGPSVFVVVKVASRQSFDFAPHSVHLQSHTSTWPGSFLKGLVSLGAGTVAIYSIVYFSMYTSLSLRL